VAGLVLCLVVAVTVYVVANRPKSAVLPHSGRAHASVGGTRAASATKLLEQLTARLRHGTREQVLELAAPGQPSSARELAEVFHNVRRVGVTHLSMRYVDEEAGRLSQTTQSRLGGRAWVADVQLGWRVGGYDAGTAHREITLTLVQTPHGAAYVSARSDYGDPAPLWLLDRLRVVKDQRSLVMVAGPNRANRFARMADRAVADVLKVLPHWRGRLVVEVPATQDELVRTLGAESGSYNEIAAVTTTVDGSLSASAPVHVFVNPAVFDPLGPNGAQIVLSHETTHVAMHAAISSMPTWLLEGFADFVALDHVNLPVSVTASQILGKVRKSGVPGHLPDQADFNSENKALGTTYEAAWLACRLIGAKYGEQKLIEFYRESNRDDSTTRAFRQILGTNQTAFTMAWQDYLRQLS
jgi:hypothetical protein